MRYETRWTPRLIQDLRAKHNLTQGNLARLLGTAQQRVAEWEKGIHSPRRSFSEAMTLLEDRLDEIQKTTKNRGHFLKTLTKKTGVRLEGRCK